MKTRSHHLNWRYRSLLYKAVRRGHARLVITICTWIDQQGAQAREWLREQAVGITFEECWPAGEQLILNRHYHSKAAALVRIAGLTKHKDATGLAALAGALADGDGTMLSGGDKDRDLKIVANAIGRSEDFWDWVVAEADATPAQKLVAVARRYARIGRPDQQVRAIAAAYLAVIADAPPALGQGPVIDEFPYWVALDQYTREGRHALNDIARDLHLTPEMVQWCFFYFEGSQANRLHPSPWWQRYCRWRFSRLKLDPDEVHLVWGPVRPHVKAALGTQGRELHRELYRWKQQHIGRVNALRDQVEAFNANLGVVGPRQSEIF